MGRTMSSWVWLKHRICTCVGLEGEELTEVSGNQTVKMPTKQWGPIEGWSSMIRFVFQKANSVFGLGLRKRGLEKGEWLEHEYH